jgi:uncharacterized membrane protein
MNVFITTLILAMLPVSELRGAIPYAIAKGMLPEAAFFVAVVANVVAIFVALFFLDYLHEHFVKISIYNRLFNRYVERVRRKAETKNMLPFVMLFLFVAIPFPGTGAYTGSIITWLFKFERKKAILTMMAAVVAAGVVVTLATLGVVKVFL